MSLFSWIAVVAIAAFAGLDVYEGYYAFAVFNILMFELCLIRMILDSESQATNPSNEGS